MQIGVFTGTYVRAICSLLWAASLLITSSLTGAERMSVGQSPSSVSSTKFDFASVRKSPPPYMSTGIRQEGDKLLFKNVTLIDCLARAYDIDSVRIHGPDWTQSERYNITAGIPEGSSDEKIREMLQGLLSERFLVKLHIEEKSSRVFSLELEKKNPGLMNAKGGQPLIVPLKGGSPGWAFTNVSMQQFLNFLAKTGDESLDAPLVDNTALPGFYDFNLIWSPQRDSSASDAISIFSAVQDLGLKLKVKKQMQKALIIDSAIKDPVEN